MPSTVRLSNKTIATRDTAKAALALAIVSDDADRPPEMLDAETVSRWRLLPGDAA